MSRVARSRTDTEDFEPDPELGGEVHLLREDADVVAGIYRFREPVEPFPYEFEQNETIVVLEGGVRIELDGGETIELDAGDVASIPAGRRATWHVRTPFREIFVLSTATGAGDGSV